MQEVPASLRTWFVVHFFADMLFAIPLLIAPEMVYALFGFSTVDVFSARLVGAALVGIGGVSLLTRHAGIESYHSLLSLKILWSVTAILGMVVSLFQGAPPTVGILIAVFVVFSMVWMYYKRKLPA